MEIKLTSVKKSDAFKKLYFLFLQFYIVLIETAINYFENKDSLDFSGKFRNSEKL